MDPERDVPNGEGAANDAGDDEATTTSADDDETRSDRFDLRGLLRQLTTPMVESLDTRLRDQVEAHVDELLGPKVDAAIRDRLSTLDRAVADLSRSLEELERRITESRLGDETS